MDREDRLRNIRELDALQKQQNRKNFACQGAGKLTGLGVLLRNSQCCSASLAHARPTMFHIPPSYNAALASVYLHTHKITHTVKMLTSLQISF